MLPGVAKRGSKKKAKNTLTMMIKKKIMIIHAMTRHSLFPVEEFDLPVESPDNFIYCNHCQLLLCLKNRDCGSM